MVANGYEIALSNLPLHSTHGRNVWDAIPHEGGQNQTDAGAVRIVVKGPRGPATLPIPGNCAKALALLTATPDTENDIISTLGNRPSDQARESLRLVLESLACLGALRRVVMDGRKVLAIIEPLGEYYRFQFTNPIDPDATLRAVRFCLMRPDDGGMVIESPLSHARIHVVEPAIATLVARLATAQDLKTLQRSSPEIPTLCILTLMSLMLANGFVTMTGSPPGDADQTLPLQHWEFHDLYFHTRSRRGRHNNAMGASFRFRERTNPPPAIKAPMSLHSIPLPRPDMNALLVNDMSVTAAIELRASIREPAARAIALQELGHFLYRCARVRTRSQMHELELTSRPYPSGGASYELEIYPVVDRCHGLLNGLYHYDPLAHALEPLLPSSAATERFIFDAYTASAGAARPNILFVITARIQRVAWKYSSIAYATILKNVGALYQTMYIVATAMRLGPCAVGAGDSDLFCLTLGNDYYEESAVGEFMLGARNIS
ncbi:SagB/ThcOx family dehydrogenase [Sinorhizobium medicae]|uniref:SagB/ThcOx family dehydrogenase n=1 Tax=Sinorhizobium medicae TaxID=110321 RepID=UPI0016485AD3|nr:SagB family peptide dehydrogenase [Sinorhizobium medicae]